ncbi:MAG: hypothetical protein WA913_17180, partial [Pricia sp.]
MKKLFGLFLVFMVYTLAGAQVKVSTNFIDESNRKAPIPNVWQVANDISPSYKGNDDGPQIRPDLKMNIIRLSGGIKSNGLKNTDYDMVEWSEKANDYVYDFTRLLRVIDKADEHSDEIYQLVIDNVPWAFQRGYTFVDLDKNNFDGVHFRKFEEIEQYGNALPPSDMKEYGQYVEALVKTLVDEYGMDRVEKWRFRIGTEIESPGHWKGTAEDFVDYLDVSIRAIRKIVPTAHVGVHTREPDYVAIPVKGLNYKGEQFVSFHNEILEHLHENNLSVDSWGLSYYIQFDKEGEFHTDEDWYDERVAPFVNHPKWNSDTDIYIGEFKATSSFRGPDGRAATLKDVSSRGEVAHIAMSKLFYEHPELNQIHRWLQFKDVKDDVASKELFSMVGHTRYQTTVNGEPEKPSNIVDGIFTLDEETDTYEALIYNYNGESTSYEPAQTVNLSLVTSLPVGTELQYRSSYYTRSHNKLQSFISEPDFQESWYVDNIKEGQKLGEAMRVLKPEIYNNRYVPYDGYDEYQLGDWMNITTEARSDGSDKGSEISLETSLESFSFRKF